MPYSSNPHHRGFAMISAAIMVAIIVAYGAIIISSITSSNVSRKNYESSIGVGALAEAGIRKAVFCMNATSGAKCGGSYGSSYVGENNVTLADGAYSTVIDNSGPIRTITATANNGKGQTKTIVSELTSIPPTDNTDFSYALQAGSLGAEMSNNAILTGTLYSAASIICGNGATINGDAYVSLSGGSINNCKVSYHAHADKVLSSTVTKNAYYKNNPADISGSTVKGTKYANQTTPPPQDLPSINLAFWRTAAEAGGTINGDYYPTNNSTLGPKKIIGNLVLTNNVHVTLNGPVWVLGNITLSNNAVLTLSSAYGQYSSTVLADKPSDLANYGKITINNNATIWGSGNPKSHILLASTNTSTSSGSPAILIENNAGGPVFLARDGMIVLSNNAGAKAMSGKKIYMANNSAVTYLESEIADMQFSNSPSNTWRTQTGTWREEP